MMLPVTFTRKKVLPCAAILVFSASAAFAADINFNINVGEPPRQVIVAPPPPVYAPPVEPIEVDDDIEFVYPDTLGFYVAVGVPYDLFYVQDSYFIYRDGRWLRSRSSHGPWVVQRYRELPPALRRHKLERIREYRTREYTIYDRDPGHYRGKHFRSEKEQWKAERREMKERRKDEKRFEKEQLKEERRFEKAQHKEEKRYEKEQRKEDKRYEKEQRKEDKRFEKEERRNRRGGREE